VIPQPRGEAQPRDSRIRCGEIDTDITYITISGV